MTARRSTAVLAAAIAASVLLAAGCTAGSSTVGSSTPTSSAAASGSAGGSAPAGTTATSGAEESGSSGSLVTPSSPAASEASLAIGFILEPTSLDFTQADGASIPQVMLTNVYETLVKLDQSGAIVPGLASKYTASADRRTYTFTMRDGVKFSSGAAFTADDVKFSFDRVVTAWKPAIKAQMAVIASTKVDSPTQVTVTLRQPSNSWLFDITGRVGAVFSRTGVADLANKPVGTGPYIFQKRNRGDSIVLQRNPSYWGHPPAVKTVTFKYFKDPSAMNSALLTGGIQVVSTEQTPDTLGQFKDAAKYQIIRGATDGEVMMTMNDGKAPLNDVRVRQAINYALDKQAILDGAWAGYGTVIGSHESPNDPWYVPDLANRYPHDVSKAKALLAAAGQSNLTLTLKLPPVPYAAAAAPFIIDQLNAAGITVKANDVTFPVWLDQVFTKADYDLTIINHVEPRDIATLWGNPSYYTRYNNKNVQQLLVTGDAGTEQEYVNDHEKVVRILADEAAAAWLWSFPNLMVANANVKGLPKNLVGESFVLSALSVG